ncbi:MAG TPA: lysozyme inhibitor LprI family protein, partial [Acidimicrobiales bacterium]|nr:lysozyme inhibitor LprI family protein [Acidimicrobiales bacterium]
FRPVLPCNEGTTLGQEGCAEHEVVALDRQLDADVRIVFGLLADDAARRDFIAAQMAWTRYRSADCNSQSDVYQGGTEQPVVYGLCLATDDASRRQDIKGFFAQLTQDRATVPKFP